jgi:formate hydrogenlyase transcriptional activator
MYATSRLDDAPANEQPDVTTPHRNHRLRVAGSPHEIISQSPALRDALDRLERVAPTGATVLITGETGTGKELFARALHRRSRRAQQPLVAVNLAAVPDTLMATELFGHEQGAFTGAVQRRIGRFEQADRATLFLDEIGELSNEIQVALLRILQEGEFERLGGSQTRRVDVRLIVATHRDLDADVEARQFRADLYYRLNVFRIHLPPLRDRCEDIPALVRHTLIDVERRVGRRFAAIEPASLERMSAYSWPGNIRELQNVVEESAILCDDATLHVPTSLLLQRALAPAPASRLDAMLEASEQQMIEDALTASGGRIAGRAGAAALLGVPPSTLESKIRRLRIDKFRFRTTSRAMRSNDHGHPT